MFCGGEFPEVDAFPVLSSPQLFELRAPTGQVVYETGFEKEGNLDYLA